MKKYKIIELIGCSGVGKTTLLDKVKDLLPKNSVLIKNDIFKSFKYNNISIDSIPVYKFLMQAKEESINESDKWISDHQKNKARTFFMRELVKDVVLSRDAGGHLIVDDDGICHNFARVIIRMQEKGLKDDLAFLLKDRVIVFVDAPNGFIVNNLIERNKKNSGFINDYYGLNDGCLDKVNKHIDTSRSTIYKLKEIVTSYGVEVLEINSDDIEAPINFLKMVNDHSNKNELILNAQEFYNRVLSLYTGHWTSQPVFKRWSYHKAVANILKEIEISSGEDVLEIGTVGLQLVKGSHTLDQDKYWNYPGKNPTYNHDARNIPWPINKKYTVIVALRVFQYLAPVQKEAFLEAKKNCSHLIIVVPKGKTYYPEGLEETYGIQFAQLLEWNNGQLPTVYQETDLGDLYYFKFMHK